MFDLVFLIVVLVIGTLLFLGQSLLILGGWFNRRRQLASVVTVCCTLSWYDFQNGFGGIICGEIETNVHFSQFYPNASNLRLGESVKWVGPLVYRCELVACQ
jgi:hypothetical protein